jgi:hypothetical protein
MVTIELSDQQAATLTAKAAAEGLTLEAWLKKLADEASRVPARSRKEAVARIREIQARSKPDPEGWKVRDYINYGRR